MSMICQLIMWFTISVNTDISYVGLSQDPVRWLLYCSYLSEGAVLEIFEQPDQKNKTKHLESRCQSVRFFNYSPGFHPIVLLRTCETVDGDIFKARAIFLTPRLYSCDRISTALWRKVR